MRVLKHIFHNPFKLRIAFSKSVLQTITAAIAAGEKNHRGEIRFAVEAQVPLSALQKGVKPRGRAVQAFSHLRVWDTAENNGVLIYVGLVDHAVEILADRGVAAKVSDAEWKQIADGAAACFKTGDWQRGALLAVEKTNALLARHFPGNGASRNELPDAPAMI